MTAKRQRGRRRAEVDAAAGEAMRAEGASWTAIASALGVWAGGRFCVAPALRQEFNAVLPRDHA